MNDDSPAVAASSDEPQSVSARTSSTYHEAPTDLRSPGQVEEGHPTADKAAHGEKHSLEDDDGGEGAKTPATVVQLEEEELPFNLPVPVKWGQTALSASIFFLGAMGSSAGNGASPRYIEQFHVSQEVATLVLSLYMVGFIVGPSIWAPLSERRGRVVVNIVSLSGLAAFQIGCALSHNIQTLLVCRFLTGVFAAAPTSNSGAWISDMWRPHERLWPMMTYTVAALGGPVVGPIVGGFLSDAPGETWRWIYWLLLILAVVLLIAVLIFERETYAPVLRSRKAERVAKEHPELEVAEVTIAPKRSVVSMLGSHLVGPMAMLCTEVPLMYASAWMSFAYGIIFLFFESLPVVFPRIYGFNGGETGLVFIALWIGIIVSMPAVAAFNIAYLRVRAANGGKVAPELRLRMTTLSAPCMLVGFLWFGWSAREGVHWIVPILGMLPIGAGLIFAFNSLGVFVTEVYGARHAASALGAMAMTRSIFAAAFPLFGRQMFEGLGPGWASSVLALVALVASPVPFIFNRWGAQIRARSKLAIKS